MNLFKKAFCRTFQAVMHAAIPLLPYREPKILGNIVDIIPVLKEKNIKNVLLIAGKRVRGLGLTAPLETGMQENGIAFYNYDKTVPNPTSDNVEEAVALYKSTNCQAIIAVGGGSPMDCAKVVGARVACPNKSLRKMHGLLKICKKIPLLIAVPTTAGTGSETTVASVIVDSETHHKYVINDFCLIPRYAVLDPALTKDMPKFLTATTGMDALTHAVEAYIGRSKTKLTKGAAEKSVKLILENLEAAYKDGNNLEARKNMLEASYLAGIAFTRSYVGYVHAIAHTLGGKYDVPHGLANAVLLPHILRAYGESATKPLAMLAKAVGLVAENTAPEAAAEALITRIEDMNARMEIPTKLDCIQKEDIPTMARLAEKEGNPLYPVPVLWDVEDIEKIYYKVGEVEK